MTAKARLWRREGQVNLLTEDWLTLVERYMIDAEAAMARKQAAEESARGSTVRERVRIDAAEKLAVLASVTERARRQAAEEAAREAAAQQARRQAAQQETSDGAIAEVLPIYGWFQAAEQTPAPRDVAAWARELVRLREEAQSR